MILTVSAVILGLLRLLGVKSIAFQAVAHLYVGGLIGAYMIGRKKLHLYLAIGLTVLETIAFLASTVFHLI